MNEDIFKKTYSNPFNWTGSKHRYLKEFLDVLPDKRGIRVLDVFTGGGDLISKLPVDWETTANDGMRQVVDLHSAVQEGLITVDKISGLYNNRGLSKTNRTAFEQLRDEYNKSKDIILLYLLMTNSFNNQLRFNSKGGFNMPFGKDRSSFNPNMKNKLQNYQDSLNKRSVKFCNEDYTDLNFKDFDLLILDPPYTNTVATYNESTGWDSEEDLRLFTKIEESNVDFIYFNQTWSKGVPNKELLSWLDGKRYTVLKNTSDSCNHQRDNSGRTEEVMIHRIT